MARSKKSGLNAGAGVAIGAGVGAALFAATSSPVWIAVGVAVGAALGTASGIGTLLEAREVWLIVTGGHKTGVLDRVLDGSVGERVPASFLRHHSNAVVIADESAVKGISGMDL